MNNTEEKSLPWYALSGLDDDVVSSTRVRFARNLANFPFPVGFRGDDAYRVQTLIFDAFSQIQGIDELFNFHAIETTSLDEKGRMILEERGALKNLQKDGMNKDLPETGVVMSLDGKSCSMINCIDHLRLSYFKSGLSLEECFNQCVKLDSALQEKLQFAASYDFGFLTSSLKDVGSAMRISTRLCLSSSVKTGNLDRIAKIAKEASYVLVPAFPFVSNGSVAGSYFILKNIKCLNGSELEQIADFNAVCKLIVETERKISAGFADDKMTVIRNSVIRAFSIAKFSLFVSLREAIDIISDVNIALRIGLISGIDYSLLNGLLYRIMPGHLLYLMESGKFSFEKDIKDNTRAKIDRLRALILQEAFEKISLGAL